MDEFTSSSQEPGGDCYYCSHFAEEKTEVQSSEGTCLRSPSLEVVVFRPQSQDHLNMLLNTRPSRFLPEDSEESGGWTPLAPDALGVSKPGVTPGPSLTGDDAICPPGRKAPFSSGSDCLPYVAAEEAGGSPDVIYFLWSLVTASPNARQGLGSAQHSLPVAPLHGSGPFPRTEQDLSLCRLHSLGAWGQWSLFSHPSHSQGVLQDSCVKSSVLHDT